ncbi:hypothetical protein NM688_g7811 [Phlebia brevispora]|uniref:Uncharacterized protein n=1 Tax=Phlebia brevispora TaxID=194682 RepID=A0ACC1S0V4_9APHY|nr:hypothetical protein NM688_g7811 [Phlebia brevispora]
MFLARSGFPVPVLQAQEPQEPSSPEVEAAASELQGYNDELERSLVSLLLGEETQNDLEIPSLPLSLERNASSLASVSA